LTSEGADASEDGTGRGTPLVAAPLVSRSSRGNAQGNSPGHNADDVVVVAAPLTKGSAAGDGVNQPGRRQEDDVNLVVGPLGGGNDGIGRRSEDDPNLVAASGVRRLTPVECERLQALPAGWTDLGGTPDSRRYSALGDAVTASVGYWIGCRL
jgi:DNA (cytosine-5)-methyltransferase 1